MSEVIRVWQPRWDRHASVPHDRWTRILQFAKAKLPRQIGQWPSLDEHTLRRVILRKKATTSAGLDGVSISDLTSMPPSVLSNFCRIFQTAEMSGEWPSQMVAGKVTCLAKVDQPASGLDFRPITVLGLLYRCWGSFHSKHAISHLESIMPEHLYGSRPGRHAAQLWSKLLWTVEHAQQNHIRLSGIVADLQKAFNCISRDVVFDVLAWVGLPLPVLCAWAGAVTQMGRRFQVRGSLSKPVFSTTGFAEGDALSCIAMVAVDLLFHAWHQHFFPLCSPLSFVDDWQLLSCNPDEIPQLLLCLQTFVAEIDMDLDLQKTFAWSVCGHTRLMLRQHGLKVALSCRSLGAHVQFSRKHTNGVQMDRIVALAQLWPRLRMSAESYFQKLRAIRVVAWPKGLHAIASTTVSQQTFQQLRSSAVRALGADGAGVNSHLHLFIHQPMCDPQFWTIMQTLKLAQSCGDRTEVVSQLCALTYDADSLPANGITSTLATRIQTLGWHVSREGKLEDVFGAFCLFQISSQELLIRAEFAWQMCVGQEVRHRKGLHDFNLTSPQLTRHWFSSLSNFDQGLARKLLNGAHFTNDGKQFCHAAQTDICPLCESSDSRFHRFWQCEKLAFARGGVPADIAELIPHLPESLTCFGWALKPSTCHAWLQHLAQIQNASTATIGYDWDVHLFTDGSCHRQHDVHTRFASWSVVIAGLDADYSSSDVLATGHLPGLLQSAYRAEVFAVLQALRASVNVTGQVFLWTDCAAVVRRTSKLIAGEKPSLLWPHGDLWAEIAECIADMQTSGLTITKVAAHRDDAGNPFEDWCFRHNALADHTAVRCNFHRSPGFWQLYRAHLQALSAAEEITAIVHDVQLRVSIKPFCNSMISPRLMWSRLFLLKIDLIQEPGRTWSPFPFRKLLSGGMGSTWFKLF